MYRYRILFLSVIIAVVVNVIVGYTGSLFLKTAFLELTLLLVFLSLFSKRGIKKEVNKNNNEGLKIYL